MKTMDERDLALLPSMRSPIQPGAVVARWTEDAFGGWEFARLVAREYVPAEWSMDLPIARQSFELVVSCRQDRTWEIFTTSVRSAIERAEVVIGNVMSNDTKWRLSWRMEE